MTDITDQDRQAAREWAEYIAETSKYDDEITSETHAAMNYILATVDAPEPTLAEDILDAAARIRDAVNPGDRDVSWADMESCADRAKQTEQERDACHNEVERLQDVQAENSGTIARLTRERDDARAEAKTWREQDENDCEAYTEELASVREALAVEGRRVEKIAKERDEARAEVERLDAVAEDYGRRATAALTERDESRAEVERLTAERLDRNPETKARVKAALNNLDKAETVTVQKGAESNAETPDPADVKPGEAWIVETHRERRTAVKDRDDDEPWNTFTAGGLFFPEDNEAITLLHRLVPAPRVITNTDELAALPHRTVIRDNAGVMFQRIVHGWYQAGDTSVHRSDDNFVCLTVTVLWEPEA